MNSLMIVAALVIPVAAITWWAIHHTNKELDGE
jgi:hypothetical protein